MEDYLKTILKSSSIGGEHGSHSVYWVPLKVFNTKLPIKRWKFNRPPDEERVIEIREAMKLSGRMDGIIYLGLVNDELVCYESNHRRQALLGIDSLEDVLVDIIWNATDDMLKQEFIRLNKAVSVPELYVDTVSEIDIELLRKTVDEFCKTYKTHKVSSNKPQRPNFNRDNLTDEFYRIMKEQHISLNDLMERLMLYNRELSMKDKSKLSEKIIEKCSDSGLWLFAWTSKLNEKEFL